jgi:hypothetical protein
MITNFTNTHNSSYITPATVNKRFSAAPAAASSPGTGEAIADINATNAIAISVAEFTCSALLKTGISSVETS